jgi:hypothetical protein
MEQTPVDHLNILELVRTLDPLNSNIRAKPSTLRSNSSVPTNSTNQANNAPTSGNNAANSINGNPSYSNINLNVISTGNSALLVAAGINHPSALSVNYLTSQLNKNTDFGKFMLQPLDFCYSDESNIRFSIINAINLCVTVIAYATHGTRAHQMLSILNILIPQYTDHLKEQTDAKAFIQSSKNEYFLINKIAVALKTMVHCADILARTFAGPKLEGKTAKNNSNRSPSILPDEDSTR